MKVGEVVVGRRLYRSGQSEYVINGRVSRLRDVQELFSGLGLGPDSYAIIEQGRIGLILNSKPMDRRAIIEEAAGITMYKTKKRLSDYLAENIWVTTSGNFSTQALHCAMLTMGADRILFSCDYPYEDYAEASDFIETVAISESDRRKIAYSNACALYKI